MWRVSQCPNSVHFKMLDDTDLWKLLQTPMDSSCSPENASFCQQCFVLGLVTGRMPSCFSIFSHGRRSVMTVKRRLQAKEMIRMTWRCMFCTKDVGVGSVSSPYRVQVVSRRMKIVTSDELNPASPFVKACADSAWFNESGRLWGL